MAKPTTRKYCVLFYL